MSKIIPSRQHFRLHASARWALLLAGAGVVMACGRSPEGAAEPEIVGGIGSGGGAFGGGAGEGGRDAPDPVGENWVFAETFHVDGNRADCDDDGPGREDAPWCSLKRAGEVEPTAEGHTLLQVEAGTYRNDPIFVRHGGTDVDHRIVYRPAHGDVVLRGPEGGRIDFGIINHHDHVAILRSREGDAFVVDGEAIVKKLEDLPAVGVKYIADIGNSNDCIYAFDHRDTRGWAGIDCTEGGVGNRYSVQLDGHGSPIRGGEQSNGDAGDAFAHECSEGVVQLDGDWSDLAQWQHPGHNLLSVQAGSGGIRHLAFRGSWGDVDTFDPEDGNRIAAIDREATRFYVDDTIWERAGVSLADNGQDPQPQALLKFAGRNNILSRSFLFDASRHMLHLPSTASTWHSTGQRIVHNVFNRSGDGYPIIEGKHTPGSPHDVGDLKIVNNAFLNVGHSVVVRIHWDPSFGAWTDHFVFAGNFVPPGAELLIKNGPGQHTVAWYEENYPANVYGNVHGATPGVAAAAVMGNDFTNVYLRYAPQAGSPLIDRGVALTRARSSCTQCTTLEVEDAGFFAHPRLDHPTFTQPARGPDAGGFRVHVAGHSVVYSSVDYQTNTIILDGPHTWAAGDDVTLHFEGAGPNIGPVE